MKKLLFMSTSLLLVLSLSGCSWVGMDVVHNYKNPSKEPKCDGYSWPLADGLLAISLGGIAAGFFVSSYRIHQQSSDSALFGEGFGKMCSGVMALIPAVLYALSSVFGLVWAHDCGKKKEAHEKWLAMNPEQQVVFEDSWIKKHVRMSRPKAPAKVVISKDQKRKNQLLHQTVKYGDKALAEKAIDDGAGVNSRDQWGWTPLHYAETADVAEMLIDRGADLNAKDDESHTPLHRAARYDRSDVAELLIEAGADVNARTTSGLTPLGVAVKLKMDNMANILRYHGGKQ